jgi:cupin 2 domain-containing protein
MKRKPINLFQDSPIGLNQEFIERLIEQDSFRMERIVSRGQHSPIGFWYDQDEHEWVAVLAGKAELQIDGQEDPVVLNPGDTYYIAAHMKHRVAWTDPHHDTIWLAVFWKDKFS